MSEEPELIRIGDDSNLQTILESIGQDSVVIEHRGVRYRVHRESLEIADDENPFAGYDPERALAGMQAAAGSWSDIDADEMKELIYRAREEGSRHFNRS